MGFVTLSRVEEEEDFDYHCVEQKCIKYKGLIVNGEKAYLQEPAIKLKFKIGIPKKNNFVLHEIKRIKLILSN